MSQRDDRHAQSGASLLLVSQLARHGLRSKLPALLFLLGGSLCEEPSTLCALPLPAC